MAPGSRASFHLSLLCAVLLQKGLPTEGGVTGSFPSSPGGIPERSTTATPESAEASGETFTVESLDLTTAGFVLRFTGPFDATSLGPSRAEESEPARPGIEVCGAARGWVSGSVVLGPTPDSMTFLRTGGPLEPDAYTLTIQGGTGGLKDLDGDLLDGNGDSVPGDDFVATFGVGPREGAVLSLPEFACGPGQRVNLPVDRCGIPVTLSGCAGVKAVEATFVYEPHLLSIDSVSPGPRLPAGTVLEVTAERPGEVGFRVMVPGTLNGETVALALLSAHVPATAPYRSTHVLRITRLELNHGDLPALADDGMHLVAYLGDATGNGGYSALDGQRVLRVAEGLATGFPPYPLVDPALVGSIAPSGACRKLDGVYVLEEVAGLDRPEIGTLPDVLSPTFEIGADPLVNIPTDLRGIPGGALTVPVNIDDADGLESVDLEIDYNPDLLAVDVAGVRTGTSTSAGILVPNVDEIGGTITVALALIVPLGPGSGSLVEVDCHVRPSAPAGETLLDLRRVSLNEDGLVLTQVPAPGRDDTDGVLFIDAPTIEVDPLIVDFGNVLVGSSRTLSVTIGNAGTAPLKVSSMTLGAGSSPDFGISDGFESFILDPGADPKDVEVTYVATDLDEDSGTLDIESTDPVKPSVSVSLTGRGVTDVALFIRMDLFPVGNEDGKLQLADVIWFLSGHLFGPDEQLDCPDAADANDDGKLGLTDAIYMLSYLFLPAEGKPPAHLPFPGCGDDPTPDSLDQSLVSKHGRCVYAGCAR